MAMFSWNGHEMMTTLIEDAPKQKSKTHLKRMKLRKMDERKDGRLMHIENRPSWNGYEDGARHVMPSFQENHDYPYAL